MSAEKTLAFVLMLDTSGSMADAINMVKIDAKAFVRMARKGDQFAINHFDTNASWVYPDSKNPKLLTVSQDLHETKDALNYILKLCRQAALRRWEMPLSLETRFGYVYKKYFDKLTAKNPNSKFYNQPNAYQMMLMFNQIVADSNKNELMLNEEDSYQQGADFVIKKFQVSASDNAAQVNVVWSDQKYKYTSGTPGGDSINIVLIDPDDKTTDIKPDIAENGYCIYNLENVKPGEWKVLIQYSVPEVITGTIGGVDFYTDIKTNLLLPTGTGTHEAPDIRVLALDGEAVLDNIKVTAQISRPIMSETDITEQYAKKLDAIMQDIDGGTDEESQPSAALEKLRSEILKTERKDIFAKQVSTHTLSLSKDGEYVVKLDGVDKPGLCNVNVKIEGVNPKTNLPFTRLKSGAFWMG